jgi:hypothetical protein
MMKPVRHCAVAATLLAVLACSQTKATAQQAAPTINPVTAPQFELPPGLHRITGTVVSMSLPKIVLSTRNGTKVTVDASDAIRSGDISTSGDTPLTAMGKYQGDTLLAQSIQKAKPDPALWLPDL